VGVICLRLLDNVYPELFLPNDERRVVLKGLLKNPSMDACFDTLGNIGEGALVGAYPCHRTNKMGSQSFIYTNNDEVSYRSSRLRVTKLQIRIASGDFDHCLDRGNSRDVHIYTCHGGLAAWLCANTHVLQAKEISSGSTMP
jgi:hypothetical protein